jgi:hypothetical protein
MTQPRCPGQDARYWKPEDIFVVLCPNCRAEIEFFKDEPFLPCRSCHKIIANPKIDLGCAKWCAHANECLGLVPSVEVKKAESKGNEKNNINESEPPAG